jgi:hypothetical protein
MINGVNDNVQRKINYLTRILDAQLNRISFGDSLWTSIIRPSIAHVPPYGFKNCLPYQSLLLGFNEVRGA